ncbi:MAG: hypothetical protein A3G20_06245 [Acidobacteria bacterium RIFCSPLOWO2_12_FULL_59_11]|nr:MAG: hypothetical protein A3G20_06245 [Acidobacteria bacterium RIFCSPLOWO2_12_FULL_59_11]
MPRLTPVLVKVTVLAEGPRGSLTKQLIAQKGLDRELNPQSCAGSIKELWAMPPYSRIEVS